MNYFIFVCVCVRLRYSPWFIVLLRKEIYCINIRCLARGKVTGDRKSCVIEGSVERISLSATQLSHKM